MTAKTCGQCAHAEAAGETVVWCYGAPPAVMSAKPAENGGTEVQIQRPLIPNTSRACAVFKEKRKSKIFSRSTRETVRRGGK